MLHFMFLEENKISHRIFSSFLFRGDFVKYICTIMNIGMPKAL